MSVEDLLAQPGNECCADCESPSPDWASINLGVLVCIVCAGVHRSLGVEYSKVRSIDMDTNCWDADLLQFMRERGNQQQNAFYEARCPAYYLRPRDCPDNQSLRAAWIRAKYVEKRFVPREPPSECSLLAAASSDASLNELDVPSMYAHEENAGDSSGSASVPTRAPPPRRAPPSHGRTASGGALHRSGTLGSSASASGSGSVPRLDVALAAMPQALLTGEMFKSNSKEQWQRRVFVLHGDRLSYFKGVLDSYAANTLEIRGARVRIFKDKKWSNGSTSLNNCFAVQTADRELRLSADSFEDMQRWAHAVRRAAHFHSVVSPPSAVGAGVRLVSSRVTVQRSELAGATRTGWMHKQGGRLRTWNRRWFALCSDAALMYFKTAFDTPEQLGGITDKTKPEGVIQVGAAAYLRRLPPRGSKRPHLFAVITPTRTFYIDAPDAQSREEWCAALASASNAATRHTIVDFTHVSPDSTGSAVAGQ